MTNDIANKLKQAKIAVAEREAEQAELRGRQKALRERLKDEFGFATVEDAEAFLTKLKTEIDTDQATLDEGIKKLDNMLAEMKM